VIPGKQKLHHAPHPPGKFNNTISQPLSVNHKSFTMITVTVLPWLQTNLQSYKHSWPKTIHCRLLPQ